MGKLKRNKVKRIRNPIGIAKLRDVDYEDTDFNCPKLTTGDINSVLEKVFFCHLLLLLESCLKFYIR